MEHVEEDRARVASGSGDDGDRVAEGAVLLAAVPSRGARRGSGDDLEDEGRARREGLRPPVPVEERRERRREVAEKRVARRRAEVLIRSEDDLPAAQRPAVREPRVRRAKDLGAPPRRGRIDGSPEEL